MRKLALLAALAASLIPPAHAAESVPNDVNVEAHSWAHADPKARLLLQQVFAADDRCRDAMDNDPKGEAACKRRMALAEQLEARGWHYGLDSQIEADKQWWHR